MGPYVLVVVIACGVGRENYFECVHFVLVDGCVERMLGVSYVVCDVSIIPCSWWVNVTVVVNEFYFGIIRGTLMKNIPAQDWFGSWWVISNILRGVWN